jgi:hypothetical protein
VATDQLPNFLYIGTSKAGSTWLFNTLALHPDVFLASNKGLYYFDAHIGKGQDWYLSHFDDTQGRRAVGEISHSYLSSPEAVARIRELNPAMRLLVCLREPVDRAFSDYLDLVKNNQFAGSLDEAVDQYPRLLDRGRYATHLQRYLDVFPAEQLHIGLFDDLKTNAQGYADEVFDFLDVSPLELPPAALKSRMPAGKPRSTAVAAAAKSASKAVKKLGLRRLRSRVKRSVAVRSALYRPYGDDRPVLDPATAARLRERFEPEVHRLDDLLGRQVSKQWGYGLRDVTG